MEQPLPARIQAIADGLRSELPIRDHDDVVLVDLTVATAIRIELYLLDPAAHDPRDRKWDLDLDRLYRRFLRCLSTLRNPRRPTARPTQAPTPGAGGKAAALGGHAAEGKNPATAPKPTTNARNALAPIIKQAASAQHQNTTTGTAPSIESTNPAGSPVNSPDPTSINDPTNSKRRPDPAKLLRQSRQERRRQARQRKDATPRASPD